MKKRLYFGRRNKPATPSQKQYILDLQKKLTSEQLAQLPKYDPDKLTVAQADSLIKKILKLQGRR